MKTILDLPFTNGLSNGLPSSEWIETEEQKRLFAVKNQTVPLEILDNRKEFLANITGSQIVY